MNATEMKPAIPASKYPDGYLDALSKEFHESTQTLKKLASAPPAPTQAQSDRLDALEYSLLKRQDQILELCSKVKADEPDRCHANSNPLARCGHPRRRPRRRPPNRSLNLGHLAKFHEKFGALNILLMKGCSVIHGQIYLSDPIILERSFSGPHRPLGCCGSMPKVFGSSKVTCKGQSTKPNAHVYWQRIN